jgi:hypothetical protein
MVAGRAGRPVIEVATKAAMATSASFWLMLTAWVGIRSRTLLYLALEAHGVGALIRTRDGVSSRLRGGRRLLVD